MGFLRFITLTSMVGLVGPMSVSAQEQGAPPQLPATDEWLRVFHVDDQRAPMVLATAVSGCPEDSEWHRRMMEGLLAPSSRERVRRFGGELFFGSQLVGCEWPPLREWFFDSLLETTSASSAVPLLTGILADWEPGDGDRLLDYLASARPDEKTRDRVIATAINGYENEGDEWRWVLRAYRAGVMTRAQLDLQLSGSPPREDWTWFVLEASDAAVRQPEDPLNARLLRAVARVLRTGLETESIELDEARVVLARIERFEGRPGFESAVGDAAQLRTIVGGRRE